MRDPAGNRAVLEQPVVCDDAPPDLRLFVPRGSDGPYVHVRGMTDTNVQKLRVDGVPCEVVNGAFDSVVRLARGRDRITVGVVDPAGNARAEEVVVGHGATGSMSGQPSMLFVVSSTPRIICPPEVLARQTAALRRVRWKSLSTFVEPLTSTMSSSMASTPSRSMRRSICAISTSSHPMLFAA